MFAGKAKTYPVTKFDINECSIKHGKFNERIVNYTENMASITKKFLILHFILFKIRRLQ